MQKVLKTIKVRHEILNSSIILKNSETSFIWMLEKQRYRIRKIGFYSFDIQTSKIEPFLEWQVRKSNIG